MKKIQLGKVSKRGRLNFKGMMGIGSVGGGQLEQKF